jgi:surface antigen
MTVRANRSTRILVLLMLIALPLAGCETAGSPGVGSRTALGGLGGAAAGGLLAAALGGSGTGIAAGTILGGLIGGVIGDRLDAADQRRAQEAATRALETAPSGRAVAWQNPDSGNAGTVMPTRTYQTSGGQYCREYQQTITISGERHQTYGTACRQPDGTWRIVS